jgi:hypothetical protein
MKRVLLIALVFLLGCEEEKVVTKAEDAVPPPPVLKQWPTGTDVSKKAEFLVSWIEKLAKVHLEVKGDCDMLARTLKPYGEHNESLPVDSAVYSSIEHTEGLRVRMQAAQETIMTVGMSCGGSKSFQQLLAGLARKKN